MIFIYNIIGISNWVFCMLGMYYVARFMMTIFTGDINIRYYFFWYNMYFCIFFGEYIFIDGGWKFKAMCIGMSIWCGFMAWFNRHNRRKKKNLLQVLGEKSKQKIQKMVDKLTPSPIPSPV